MRGDVLVLGGEALWQADAVLGFGGSVDSPTTMRVRTKPYAILDEHGEVGLRRIRLIGYVSDEASFRVTPVVDGRRWASAVQTVTVTARVTGSLERFESVVSPYRVNRFGGRSILRGSEFALDIELRDPAAGWHLDAATIEFEAVGRRRRRVATGYSYTPPPAVGAPNTASPETLTSSTTLLPSAVVGSTGFRVEVSVDSNPGTPYDAFLTILRDDRVGGVTVDVVMTSQDVGGGGFGNRPASSVPIVSPASLESSTAVTPSAVTAGTGFVVTQEIVAPGVVRIIATRDDRAPGVPADITITSQDIGGATVEPYEGGLIGVPPNFTVAQDLTGAEMLTLGFRDNRDWPDTWANNPVSPRAEGGALRIEYDVGYVVPSGSYDPGLFEQVSPMIGGPIAYHRYDITISDNFRLHHSETTKAVFFPRSRAGNPVAGGTVLNFAGTGESLPLIELATQQLPEFLNADLRWNGSSDPAYGPNYASPLLADAQIQRGVRNTFEIILGGGTPGVADGFFLAYLNGVLVLDYRDIMQFAAADNPSWRGVKIEPIWGGLGGSTGTAPGPAVTSPDGENMWMDFERVVVAFGSDYDVAGHTPTDPTVGSVSADRVEVSWTAAGPWAHELYYRETGTANWIFFVTIPGGSPIEAEFLNLESSTSYDFAARALSVPVSNFSTITQATSA